jgi:hypothetical protein
VTGCGSCRATRVSCVSNLTPELAGGATCTNVARLSIALCYAFELYIEHSNLQPSCACRWFGAAPMPGLLQPA